MIPGGNDSFGTGISAGGAQVMGQSAGLNDLVKLGMARQRQRQVKPWNAPITPIDTQKIKSADIPAVMQGYASYRDNMFKSNAALNPEERAYYYTQGNNDYVNTLALADKSTISQAKLQTFRHNVNDPSFDPTQTEPYNKAIGEYEGATTGSAEEKAAEAKLPLGQYQKVDVSGMEKSLNAEVQKSANLDINQNAPGAVKDMHYQEKKVASFQTMLGTLDNYSAGNRATKNMFTKQGQDIIDNSGNTQYLQNLKGMGNIDPTDATQVGQANYIYHKIDGLKGASVTKDSHLYPGKGLNISIGGQQAPTESQALNGIITPGGVGNINASQKAIADNGGELPTVKTQYRMNYDRIFGNGGKKATLAGGSVFSVSDGKTLEVPPATEMDMVGTSNQYKFKDGVVFNGHKMDGGYANASTVKKIEDDPNGATAKNFTKVNITHGYMTFPSEDGNPPVRKQVFYPTENLPDNQMFGKTSGKSSEAKSNSVIQQSIQNLRIKSNQANPTHEANIEQSFKGKTLPGYKKSK